MAAAAAGAAAAVAIAEAIKASGVLVRMDPANFVAILARAQTPLVVHAPGSLFAKRHHYLTSYKGLAFLTATGQPLDLPPAAEVIEARRIWTPG
jgi:hypothetical protein